MNLCEDRTHIPSVDPFVPPCSKVASHLAPHLWVFWTCENYQYHPIPSATLLYIIAMVRRCQAKISYTSLHLYNGPAVSIQFGLLSATKYSPPASIAPSDSSMWERERNRYIVCSRKTSQIRKYKSFLTQFAIIVNQSSF